MYELITNRNLPIYAIEFLESLIKRGRKASTISRYAYDLEDFFSWISREKQNHSFQTFQHVTTKDLEKYMTFLTDKKQYSPQTMQRILIVLNQLYKYFIKKKVLHVNPVSNLPYKTGQLKEITNDDFITDDEAKKLYETVRSLDGLTDNQKKARSKLIARNESIFILLIEYGLTLQELTNITMNDIHFEWNTVDVGIEEQTRRTITIHPSHKKVLYDYYQMIPKPVRPRYRSSDPFFVAFDFQRDTYRWVYATNSPKKLTKIAIQKMIREESKRAGLQGKSQQHFRHTAVLKALQNQKSIETIKTQFGFQTEIAFKRIIRFFEQEQEQEKKKKNKCPSIKK